MLHPGPLATLLFTLAACALSGPLAAAQTLVDNLNQVPVSSTADDGDSSPTEFTRVGERIYFAAQRADVGRELFWMPEGGGQPRLVADLEPGAFDSDPVDLIPLPGDRLFFVANTSAAGREPWVTDGTAAGTVLLGDLVPGSEDSFPNEPTAFNGEVWFYARDGAGAFSPSLWRTDGTSAGTQAYQDMGLTGGYSGDAQQIEAAGPWLYYGVSETVFTQGTLVGQWRLYRTDGSPGGATLLREQIEDQSFGAKQFRAAGSNLAFVANGQGDGVEVWVSDGSPGGTLPLDLEPGSASSNPFDLTTVGGEVYFAAQQSGVGREVFRTDGTPLGTFRVTDIPGGPFNGGPLWLREANGQLFFSAPVPGEGYELWTTTGAFASETLFAVFNPGAADSNVQELVGFAGGIVCAPANSGVGVELWFSAGSPSSTVLLADTLAGSENGWPRELAVIDGRVYFSSDELFTGREIWSTDGTPAGTALVADLAQPATDASSAPGDFVSLGDRMLFVANDGLVGRELWVSDGTATGTELVLDISNDDSDIGPRELLAFSDGAIFPADDEVRGREMWFSDGTPEGTYLLADIGPGASGSNPFPLAVFDGWAYFIAQGAIFQGYDLYRTDGTPEATQFVSSVDVDWSLNGQNAIAFDGWLYVAASDGAGGSELWRLNSQGLERVVDLAPGAESGVPELQAAVFNGELYFAGNDGSTGLELFKTDGTAAGTTLVAELNPSSDSWPRDLVVANERLMFLARPGVQVEWLWVHDGQTTAPLTDDSVEFRSGWPLFSNGDVAMSIVSVPGTLRVLYGSDGTPQGTGPILPITDSFGAFVNLRVFDVTSGDKRYFSAADEAFGAELWVTDGTTAGTERLTDIAPGPLDSWIEEVGRFGDQLWFTAFQQSIGFELWTLPLAPGDHVAEPFGQGCAGSSGSAPTIGATGAATVGSPVSIDVAGAAPSSLAAHYSSLAFGLSDAGGCSVYLADPLLMLLTPTDALGRTSVPLQIPADPALIGLNLWWQTLVADPGGALGGSGALTPALEVWIGG